VRSRPPNAGARRRFAYEIDHKTEGYYLVMQIVAEGGALDDIERQLRLADDIVRHKLIRLPDVKRPAVAFSVSRPRRLPDDLRRIRHA